jgi:hypothetical protein
MRAPQGTFWFSLVATAALPLLAGLSAGQGPAKKPAAIFSAAEAAVAARRLESSKPLGFHNRSGLFREVPADGAVLVGFDCGVGKFGDIETVYALRAVYMTAHGETSGQEHGLFYGQRKVGKRTHKSKVVRRVRVMARPGYAVGGVTIRSGLNINGLSLTFMRVVGGWLDPAQSYESEWVGDRTGGGEASLERLGAPVVGIHGSQDVEHVSSLGLIYITEPPVVAQAPPRTEQPAPPPRVEVPLVPAAPPAPPKEERAQAPPAAPKEEKQAEGPAAPNPARDEDRPWPEPKPKAPARRVAQAEPAEPAPEPPAAEGADWLPFVGFAAVLVPAFCLVLFVTLGRKKPAPAPERRAAPPPKVDPSKAPPATPAAPAPAPPNPTAICDRPRPTGGAARSTPPAESAPSRAPEPVLPVESPYAKPNARVYYHVTCGKATIVSGDDYVLLECPFRPVSSTYCCGCQTFVPLHMVRWADSDEMISAYRERVRKMVPFWRQVYLALFGSAYEGAVNWGKEWKGGPLPRS